MPEAFAVLAVFVIVVASYIGALVMARDPARQNAPEEMARLRQHYAWLEDRLKVARRENWDDEMVHGLADELDATAQEITTRMQR